MWKDLKVAVIIPAYNESAWIGKTLSGIPESVDRVIVVDDCSTDQTARAVKLHRDSRVRLLKHETNQGVGRAIVSGYLDALQHGFDLLAVMAGDNQMCPDDLPALLDAATRGIDYAKGNRLIHPSAKAMPWKRRLGSGFLSWLTRRVTGLPVGDCQCGYTVLRADCAALLPLERVWPRYGYPNDLLQLLAANGASVADVPVKPLYQGESSGLHVGHLFSITARIMARRNYHRAAACSSLQPESPFVSQSREAASLLQTSDPV